MEELARGTLTLEALRLVMRQPEGQPAQPADDASKGEPPGSQPTADPRRLRGFTLAAPPAQYGSVDAGESPTAAGEVATEAELPDVAVVTLLFEGAPAAPASPEGGQPAAPTRMVVKCSTDAGIRAQCAPLPSIPPGARTSSQSQAFAGYPSLPGGATLAARPVRRGHAARR